MNARKLLIQAMGKLASEKPFEDITAQEILDEAEVSRYTFYKYFSDKYDLANAYYESYVADQILVKYTGHNWKDILTEKEVFRSQFVNYESCVSFAEWLKGGCQMPPEKIAGWIDEMTPNEYTEYQHE